MSHAFYKPFPWFILATGQSPKVSFPTSDVSAELGMILGIVWHSYVSCLQARTISYDTGRSIIVQFYISQIHILMVLAKQI